MSKQAMNRLDKIWRDRGITIVTKKRLVGTLVFSVYGAETWTIKAYERARIDAFEMWCWRRMLRIPWIAHRTNESVLSELHITTRLSTICMRRILNYFGHIVRRDPDNLEKTILLGRVEGRRSRGRIPTRWTDQIKEATRGTLYEAVRRAADRTQWGAFVSGWSPGGHDPQF